MQLMPLRLQWRRTRNRPGSAQKVRGVRRRLGLPWTPLISGHLPALSHCHLFHSGPAPRRQQRHLSPRQKSQRTHLENLLLCTFSRSTFTPQRAEPGKRALARSGPCCRSTSLVSHPGFISQIRPKCDFFFFLPIRR